MTVTLPMTTVSVAAFGVCVSLVDYHMIFLDVALMAFYMCVALSAILYLNKFSLGGSGMYCIVT